MRMQLVVLIVAMFLVAQPLQAEVPLLKSAELQKLAKHIATGKVQNVYTAEKNLGKGYLDTLFAVEVAVTGVEKGKGISPKQVIYAKAWRMKQRAPGWAGPSGQDVIPKPGQTVKLYLTGADGGYDALSPNGINVVGQKKTK